MEQGEEADCSKPALAEQPLWLLKRRCFWRLLQHRSPGILLSTASRFQAQTGLLGQRLFFMLYRIRRPTTRIKVQLLVAYCPIPLSHVGAPSQAVVGRHHSSAVRGRQTAVVVV